MAACISEPPGPCKVCQSGAKREMHMTDETKPTELTDATAFADNMAQLYETSQEIWKLYLDSHKDAPDPDPMNMMPTLNNFASALAMHPQAMIEKTFELWQGQFAIWQAATNKLMGSGEPDPIPNLPEGGKRFAHTDWSENAVFEYVKRSYLLTSDWAQSLVETAGDGISERDARKMRFHTRTMVEAMNPANFFALNPEVLETTRAENGANLVRGAKMMLEDMQRGKGELLIRQTDMDAFEVGRDMAVTPGKVVWENDLLQLIQYAPSTKEVHQTPLLFVPPWINKYYVLDLNKKKSLMQWLVAQGHTVFIISWVNPDAQHKDKSWEDYMFGGVEAALDKVLEETGAPQAHLASYCIGGTLVGTLMAHLSKRKDTRVASTTFFTAQLDFIDAGELQLFVDDTTLAQVNKQMAKGYLPAQSMAKAFNMLRSNDLIWSYMVNNYMLGKEPFPFDLLYWNSDSTAMPAKVHHFYLESFYIDNLFARDGVPVRGEALRIPDIAGKIYHIATIEDHIAPAASVYRGARMMENADVTFVLSGSGHIAGVVNPPAAKKYQYWVGKDLAPEALDDWKSKAKMTEGSWWPHWDGWLSEMSGDLVPARTPGATLGAIEDAPGRYVCKRFDA